jgi:diketogulonate reductase-like aldo/keto reductase
MPHGRGSGFHGKVFDGAIGVSNFMPHHLKRLLAATDIVPAVNQIELHPYFTQPDVQAVAEGRLQVP